MAANPVSYFWLLAVHLRYLLKAFWLVSTRKRPHSGGVGGLLDSLLPSKFALCSRHADLHGLRKRRGKHVRFGDLDQLVGCERFVFVVPITNEDGGAPGQYAP